MCTSEAQCTQKYIPHISTKRKIDFSSIPISQIPSSPVLNTRRKNHSTVLNVENIDTSPVLNSRRREDKCSPVLHTNKFKKQRILESNKKCVRKLQYESEINNIGLSDNSNISSVKLKLNFNSEHIKEPVKNNDWFKFKIFNEYDFKKHKRKSMAKNKNCLKKYATCEEDIVIETVCSQELQDEIEHSIMAKLQSPRNILKNVLPSSSIEENSIELVYSQEELEKTEIEIFNSQEIAKTNENENITIEEMNSQNSSGLSNISNFTIVPDSYEKSSDEYIWSPIKKKKYKPGTYSHKFQRILRKQKASAAIWKHELYLAKSTNYVIPLSEDDSQITIVKICKINFDYGVNVLECVEMENQEKCLVVADLSQLFDDVVLKIKDVIKMYPPFLIKHLKIDECDIKTFINVHKILKC